MSSGSQPSILRPPPSTPRVIVMRFDVARGRDWRLGHLYYYDANDFATLAVTAIPFGLYFLHVDSPGGRPRARRGRPGGADAGLCLVRFARWIPGTHRRRHLRRHAVPRNSPAMAPLGHGSGRSWSCSGPRATGTGSRWARSCRNRTTTGLERQGASKYGSAASATCSGIPCLASGPSNFQTAEGTISPLAERQQFGIGVRWSAAHNTFIQAGAELGFPGLFFFTAILATAFRALRRSFHGASADDGHGTRARAHTRTDGLAYRISDRVALPVADVFGNALHPARHGGGAHQSTPRSDAMRYTVSLIAVTAFFVAAARLHPTSLSLPQGPVLFHESFDDAQLESRNWYDGTNTSLSAPGHTASSSRSLEYRFDAGSTKPSTGSPLRRKFAPSDSVYLSYHVKYSENWVGSQQLYHPHEFHFLTTDDGDWTSLSNTHLTVYVEQKAAHRSSPSRMARTSIKPGPATTSRASPSGAASPAATVRATGIRGTVTLRGTHG